MPRHIFTKDELVVVHKWKKGGGTNFFMEIAK